MDYAVDVVGVLEVLDDEADVEPVWVVFRAQKRFYPPATWHARDEIIHHSRAQRRRYIMNELS